MLLVFIFAKVVQFSDQRLQTMAPALSALTSTLLKVLQGHWFMIFASFLIMSTNGSGNVFAIYSKDIKSSLNYNQQSLNTVSFFKDLGSNIGIISGLINEIAPPSLLLLIGAAANLFGYLMIYFAITNRTARPHLWQMCLYIAVGANSQSFGNTAALVTCVKNFPENRGIVLGLLKGFIGISGAVFTQLYLAIYGDDSESLVLLIAWLPSIVCIIFLRTVRILKDGQRTLELRVLFSFLYMSLALAAYLMIMIIVQKRAAFSHTEYVASATGVLLLLFLPLLVVIREEIKQKEPLPVISSVQEPKSSLKCEICAGNLSCLTSVFELPERGEDYSILQAIFSVDMTVLFIAMICGAGGALAAIDNLGQIGESLAYPPRSIGTFVSLMSIWNFLGRITAGFASEILLARYKLPRPLLLSLVLLLSCVGYLLVAFDAPNSLYFASIIIGFCSGAQNPLLFVIISELFGLKHYSTLYNFGAMASPIGSYVFNVRVAGHLYDREAAKQGALLSSKAKYSACKGVQCYKLSFIIITVATLLGALVMLVLVWRTWGFYKGDVYARYKNKEEMAIVEERLKGENLQ